MNAGIVQLFPSARTLTLIHIENHVVEFLKILIKTPTGYPGLAFVILYKMANDEPRKTALTIERFGMTSLWGTFNALLLVIAMKRGGQECPPQVLPAFPVPECLRGEEHLVPDTIHKRSQFA